MDFQKILSGKEKVQILHLGYHMKWNKGPQRPHQTTYFKCVEKGCKVTMATLGALEGELTLKFHHYEVLTFRDEVKTNPDRPIKQLFEEISTKALDSVEGTPNKLDLAKKMPVYRKGMFQSLIFNNYVANELYPEKYKIMSARF